MTPVLTFGKKVLLGVSFGCQRNASRCAVTTVTLDVNKTLLTVDIESVFRSKRLLAIVGKWRTLRVLVDLIAPELRSFVLTLCTL